MKITWERSSWGSAAHCSAVLPLKQDRIVVSTGLRPELAQLCDSRDTACLQRLSRHFQPTARDKTLPGNLLQEEPCALHTTPALEENLNPFHRVSLSGDQAQADAMAPGARFREAAPWLLEILWLSSWPRTHSGDSMRAPVVMPVHTAGAHFWSSPNTMDQSRAREASKGQDSRGDRQNARLRWSLMHTPPLCMFSFIAFNLKTIPKHAYRYLYMHLSVSDALKRQIQFLRKPRVWNKDSLAFVGS